MTRMNLAIWYLNLMLFDGPVSSKEIISTGIQLGFSKTSLERAKKAVGIKTTSERSGINGKILKWWWG